MNTTEGLYDRGYLIDFGDNEVVVHRTPITYIQSVKDSYYVIVYGDTLYSISRKYYGSSSLWFMIADVNDNIEDIFDLPFGDTILIPNISLIQSFYAGFR